MLLSVLSAAATTTSAPEPLTVATRQQHAKRKHVLEAVVIDPFALIDEYAMHQRDLSGGAAKA